jgi:hypothetical protein
MAVEYRLYIPMADNNGIRIPRADVDSIVRRAVDIAGGCTLSAVSRGYWRADNGREYRDPVRVLSAVDSAQHRAAWRALARQAAVLLRQESILLTVSSAVDVEYIGQGVR